MNDPHTVYSLKASNFEASYIVALVDVIYIVYCHDEHQK